MTPSPRSAPPDLPGFTYTSSIGGGGFADVFGYTQHRPNRKVAVKVLRSEHLNEVSLQQFETEADVMAEVSEHPYIVTVYTAGIAPDGRPYIVMEHYPQPHFGVRARGGKLPVSEVLRVAVQVCSAVETAHEASILHRDIKPANILTSAFGRPGLTDFGISGVRREGVVEAAAGVTIPFAPPEILLDDAASGSELSDVYALGATIYALLAGRPPHWIPGGQNDDGAMISRIAKGPPVPTGREDTGPLEHLLAGAMAKDPDHRPRSALALAQALQDVEHQLRLPPTPIEVRSDLHVHREIDRSDEEGTRRPPQVVNPNGPSAPRSGSVGPQEVFTTRARGSGSNSTGAPAALAPSAPGGEGALALRPSAADLASPVGGETVQRPATPTLGAGADLAIEPEPSASPAEATAPKLPATWIMACAAAAAIALVAVVVISITSGSQAQQTEREAAISADENDPPPGPAMPIQIQAPSDVSAVWDSDRSSMTVTWTPPPEAEQHQLTYLVRPKDPADQQPIDEGAPLYAAFDDQASAVDDTEVVIQELEVGDEGPPCIDVMAVGPNGRGSDYSLVACP